MQREDRGTDAAGQRRQLADQVLVLRGGSSYASGTPAAVLTETLFRQVFGVEVESVSSR